MSKENSSDSSDSTSESEISACSSSFVPLKALYSNKIKVPLKNAPIYENVAQFEASRSKDIIAFGHGDLVKQREEEKARIKMEKQKELEEKNERRYAKFEALVPTKPRKMGHNVFTRMAAMEGPLSALKQCVDQRIRVKVITRNANGIRGELHATVVAFDKQWNLAMTDVLEIWKRKVPKKRKVPPALGVPVEKGSAAKISPVPVVTETPVGGGVMECTRHIPQLMVRGEHVVLINIVEL